MPPVVDGEEARRPAGRRGGEEVDAVPLAAFHLEDVRQRVHRPDVPRIVVQGGPGARLGLPVVRVLLKPERVDALHVPPAGKVAWPGGQHPGGGVAELEPVAEEEVEVLGDLEREQVARMAQQCTLQRAGRGFPVTVDPVPGGAQVVKLPLAHERLVQPLQDLARGGDALRGRPVQLQVGAVDMAEHQAVVGRDRGVGVRHRVARQRGQVLDGRVEQGHRVGAARPDGNVPAIRECLSHLGPSLPSTPACAYKAYSPARRTSAQARSENSAHGLGGSADRSSAISSHLSRDRALNSSTRFSDDEEQVTAREFEKYNYPVYM